MTETRATENSETATAPATTAAPGAPAATPAPAAPGGWPWRRKGGAAGRQQEKSAEQGNEYFHRMPLFVKMRTVFKYTTGQGKMQEAMDRTISSGEM